MSDRLPDVIVEQEQEGKYGAGSGTIRCYVVEARCRMEQPEVLVSGEVLDGRWRRIHFPAGPIGVKVELWNRQAEAEGFLDFSAAQALAWWFIANAQSRRESGTYRTIGIETRLVQVEFTYSYSAKEIGVSRALGNHDDRDVKFEARPVGSPRDAKERKS